MHLELPELFLYHSVSLMVPFKICAHATTRPVSGPDRGCNRYTKKVFFYLLASQKKQKKEFSAIVVFAVVFDGDECSGYYFGVSGLQFNGEFEYDF